MVKAQLLDRDTLFIRFGKKGTLTNPDQFHNLTGSEHGSRSFAVYSLAQHRFVRYYHSPNLELLRFYEDFTDFFLPPSGGQHGLLRRVNTIANNPYLRADAQRYFNLARSHHGVIGNLVNASLAKLPCSSQMVSPSPYLDLKLFQYNRELLTDEMVTWSPLELPIKVLYRRPRSSSSQVAFRIHTSPLHSPLGGAIDMCRRHIFHPTLPFIMTVVDGEVIYHQR